MFKILSIIFTLFSGYQLYGQELPKVIILYSPEKWANETSGKAGLVFNLRNDTIEVKAESKEKVLYTATYYGKNRPVFTSSIYEKKLPDWKTIEHKSFALKCVTEKRILLMLYDKGTSASIWLSDQVDCYPKDVQPFMKAFINWLNSDW